MVTDGGMAKMVHDLRYFRYNSNKYPNAAHPNRHGSLVMFLVTDDRSVILIVGNCESFFRARAVPMWWYKPTYTRNNQSWLIQGGNPCSGIYRPGKVQSTICLPHN